ncbi:protein tyrosine phosphatase [Haloactinopolyspora alba]|uniref:protein-tyrosine-phosphatase n=1 Tax=Haloactinopolyspora alba TaxID=648780 RepID=A0A2P8EFX5_9ACTN|nr:protein tyrosine phosphatase [Haloactinopolyspora alba]
MLRDRLREAGLGARVSVDSAGTGAWHLGDPADRRALDVLQRHGYDGSAHRARQFRAEWFASTDLVLAMDRDHLAHLHALAPDAAARASIQLFRAYDVDALTGGDLDVPDPYFDDHASFERVLSMVESAAAGIVGTLRNELTVAEAEGGEPGRG